MATERHSYPRLSQSSAIVVGISWVVLATACASGRMGPKPDTEPRPGPHTLKKLTVAERQAAMARARVWRPLDTASLDIIRGPNLGKLRIPAAVTCDYVHPDKPLRGNTPKFLCDLASSAPSTRHAAPGTGHPDVVKVKYGEKNGEVYAETASSRLLWALGFQTDVMYPARVTCHGCPDDPFLASKDEWRRQEPAHAGARSFHRRRSSARVATRSKRPATTDGPGRSSIPSAHRLAAPRARSSMR